MCEMTLSSYRVLELAQKEMAGVKNFDFPKFHHSVAHLLDLVHMFGSPNNGRCSWFETSLQELKQLYQTSNKRNFIEQMKTEV